jgi:SLT domain-containing protein
MATKKQTTKRDDATELARHISAILNHPATPVDFYNDLADAVNDLDVPQGHYDTVEYIAARLASTIGQRARAKSKRG